MSVADHCDGAIHKRCKLQEGEGQAKPATLVKMANFSNKKSGQWGEGTNIPQNSRRTSLVVQAKAEENGGLGACPRKKFRKPRPPKGRKVSFYKIG